MNRNLQNLRRKNVRTAWLLVVLAIGVAASVFVWRYQHGQPPLPQGSSYSATYEVQPQPAQPQSIQKQ